MLRRYNTVVYPPHSNGVVLFGHISVIQGGREVFEEMSTPMDISNKLCTASVPSVQFLVDKSTQSYFSLPTCCHSDAVWNCCHWDAVLYWKHREWPPPTELQLVNCEVVLRPLPCSSCQIAVGNSAQLWKPPWYVTVQQTVRCVVAELVEHWEYLMVICWNSVNLYLQMSKHIASVDTDFSPCYVKVVGFSEFENPVVAMLSYLLPVVSKGKKHWQFKQELFWQCLASDSSLPGVLQSPMYNLESQCSIHEGGGSLCGMLNATEIQFGSAHSRTRLLVDYEPLEARVSRAGFMHFSAIAQTEFHVLHYFSSCCVYNRLVERVQLLHLLSQGASNPLLFLCWAILQTRIDWFLCCIVLQPWPPPPTLHTDTASELVETMSVGSKLNVLDHVTFATTDLIELPGNLVWFHGKLLFNIKDLQMQWDPGGTELFPSAWGQAKAQGGGSLWYHFILRCRIMLMALGTDRRMLELGKASGQEGVMLVLQQSELSKDASFLSYCTRSLGSTSLFHMLQAGSLCCCRIGDSGG